MYYWIDKSPGSLYKCIMGSCLLLPDLSELPSFHGLYNSQWFFGLLYMFILNSFTSNCEGPYWIGRRSLLGRKGLFKVLYKRADFSHTLEFIMSPWYILHLITIGEHYVSNDHTTCTMHSKTENIAPVFYRKLFL